MDSSSVPPAGDAPSSRPSARCPGCGATRTAADSAGVAWSSRHVRAGAEVVVEFVCPACTRADIAQIEAGLPVGLAVSA